MIKKLLIILPVAILTLIPLFYIFCVNHISYGEIGIQYNRLNGDWKVQEEPGFYITSPATKVVTLSILPQKVYENRTSWNVIAAKTLKINKDHIKELIDREGVSYNLSIHQKDMMMTYYMSGKKWKFLEESE